jgi:hypothetical protein
MKMEYLAIVSMYADRMGNTATTENIKALIAKVSLAGFIFCYLSVSHIILYFVGTFVRDRCLG